MTQTARPNLIRMIRLLDGELSADEAAPLRRLIANDLKLAEQYQQLTQVLQQPMSPDELLQHADQVDPISLAEFVDGRMTEPAQMRFEQKCWASDSLLREVVSTWRAEHEGAATGWNSISENRVQSVVSSLLARSGVEQPPVTIQPECQPQAVQEVKSEQETASVVLPELSDVRQIVVAPDTTPVRPRSRRSTKGILAAGLVLALVVVAMQFIGRPDVDQQAQPGNPDRKVGPEGSDPPTMIVREGPESDSIPPDKESVIPDSPDPKDRMEQNPIVRKDPDSTPMPEKPLPDPGLPLPPPVELVEWSDVRGIVGVRESTASEWSGLLNTKVANLWKSNARTQLLTLANSAAAGDAVNGARLMAAADSLVEIAAERKQGSRNAPAADAELLPSCEVQFGRLAFVGLNKGQRVIVLAGGESFEIRATRDETTIAIERDSQEIVLAAYRGEASVDGHELTRRRFGRVDSSGSLSVFRPVRVNEWTRARPGPVSLPADLCAEFNGSANLLQKAGRVRQSPDPVTAYVATQVALQCSASGSQPLPLNLARQIAGSGNEIHRQTLVQWLVTRVQRNPSAGDADLKLLFRLQQIDRQTATRMSGWFQAAAGGSRPTVMQLTELTVGLRDPAPLFTKQCAKFFLQKILGDPLTEYDPRAPASRTALSSVTRKVRAWQQANLQ